MYNSAGQIVTALQAGWGKPPIKLAIYSSDGSTVLREIENDEDGEPLFRTGIIDDIRHVKQNGNGDYVVVEKGMIVCVSSEGRFRWEYRVGLEIYGMVCDGISWTRSLSIDRHGQLWIGQEYRLKVVKYRNKVVEL